MLSKGAMNESKIFLLFIIFCLLIGELPNLPRVGKSYSSAKLKADISLYTAIEGMQVKGNWESKKWECVPDFTLPTLPLLLILPICFCQLNCSNTSLMLSLFQTIWLVNSIISLVLKRHRLISLSTQHSLFWSGVMIA